MNRVNLAVPLFGKMAARSYHSPQLVGALNASGLDPKYFVIEEYLNNPALSKGQYFRLDTPSYDAYLDQKPFLRALKSVRRFGLVTETTDLRLRERIEQILFEDAPLSATWRYALLMNLVRGFPKSCAIANGLENLFYKTSIHKKQFKDLNIGAVLTPGMGGYGFYNECLFAREAKQLGLPVFASITNYDNLVNMGFRGITPDCVGVWSKAMADDAMKLQGMPASKIEVTGPVQFDRYFKPLSIGRDAFLKSKGLDPNKKTILHAGGANIFRYLEFYELLFESGQTDFTKQCNIIFRVYPNKKVLDSPAWRMLAKLLEKHPNVYISNSLESSSDTLSAELQDDLDELHCLLRYSDVMVNYFSTVSLESAMCDLPTIHAAYDKFSFTQRYMSSTHFQRRQTHNRRPKRLKAGVVCSNDAELVKALNAYLNNRQLHKAERLEYALSEIDFMDGKSSERLVKMVHSRI